jgi:hypothetical protein
LLFDPLAVFAVPLGQFGGACVKFALKIGDDLPGIGCGIVEHDGHLRLPSGRVRKGSKPGG